MRRNILGLGAMVVGLAACGGDDGQPPNGSLTGDTLTIAPVAGAAVDAPTARAVFRDAENAEIGTATLTQVDNGVRIDYDIVAMPGGAHGFHLHAVGACDPATFESAGDHFNPEERAHGKDHPDGPHPGDLENIEAGSVGGAIRGTVTNERVSLLPDQPNSLLDADGTALVIHADPDDYISQPSGNAGDRIACAVIEAA